MRPSSPIATTLAAACVALASACSSHEQAAAPEWLEPDSLQAIQARLLADFPYTVPEVTEQLMALHPEITADSVDQYIARKYIEVMDIDGTPRVHRKWQRNFHLLNPAYNGGWRQRGWDASEQRLAYADSVIRYTAGTLPDGGAHRHTVRFTIDVPYHPELAGDTLRVWMPYPIESERQTAVKLLDASSADYVISEPDQSVHRTIYMQAPIDPAGNSFSYTVELVTKGKYCSPQSIMAAIKPYDTESDLYKRYTAFDDGPHYVQLDSLARAIVGDETNPYRQSELVYDHIISTYPWAGAREYSTIECIPQYVIDSGHGDCGQVALLYISLMRSLGVPSRWESGWMLHPGEKNYHDWAETYYEGVGWVPVDVSFGRYTPSADPAVVRFNSTGIDSYRFATNTGVGAPFYPAKRYVRSETVDSQAGEVECSAGNLFYPAWDSTLEIISSTPIEL